MPSNSSSKQFFVIGAGFHKTGTTTLVKALSILGYRVKGISKKPLIPIFKKRLFTYKKTA